jgi:hypothetical protein
MNIPFSSALPDAVQKSLGLTGSAGTVKEVIIGVLVVVTAVWALLKGMIWIRKSKTR